MTIRTSVLVTLVGVFAVGGAALSADEMTLTGTVGDANCGVKHPINDSVACTLGCVKNGSDFALIVEDDTYGPLTAYTLKASSDEIKGELEELAGKMAKITGDVEDDVVTVASVEAVR